MRIISSPVFQLRDIIRALLTSPSSTSFDLISTFLTYGQSLGASSIHGYLVDRSYETQTLINDEFSSYQGKALCITYDITLTEQQWEDIFGIHESTSVVSRTASSFFHLSDFLCILSGSRVVYYDPNERMVNDERAYVSIFDLEHDDIDMFQDQFSPLDYFLFQSKTFYNGTLIRLPLRTLANATKRCNPNLGRHSTATLSILLVEALLHRPVIISNQYQQDQIRLYKGFPGLHALFIRGETTSDHHP